MLSGLHSEQRIIGACIFIRIGIWESLFVLVQQSQISKEMWFIQMEIDFAFDDEGDIFGLTLGLESLNHLNFLFVLQKHQIKKDSVLLLSRSVHSERIKTVDLSPCCLFERSQLKIYSI